MLVRIIIIYLVVEVTPSLLWYGAMTCNDYILLETVK